MEKSKLYLWTKFPSEVIKETFEEFQKHFPESGRATGPASSMEVTQGDTTWDFDDPSEFYAQYRSDCSVASFMHPFREGHFYVLLSQRHGVSLTTVKVSLPKRGDIESVFEVFEAAVSQSRVEPPKVVAPPVPPTRVFIGHGRDLTWRDLKDHLSDKQGFAVEAYEIGARAGFTVQQVLDQMLTGSSFAILVLTGEVKDVSGVMHARDNVIHELGLFQGKLGLPRTVALVEDDVEVFSNLQGVNQIRFPRGHFAETFGDVVATIRRELGG